MSAEGSKKSIPNYPKYVHTGNNNISHAVREACNPMQNIADPDHDGLPYFGNIMSGDDPHNYHHINYSLSHVPGRWLAALLSAEHLFGVKLEESVIENLRKWAFRSMDHKMGLSRSLDLTTYEILPVSNLHNLREVAHAFWSLAYFRNDEAALDAVLRQIITVDRYLNFETGVWDEAAFIRERDGSTNYSDKERLYPFPFFFGRYIGPLVKLYRDCGLIEALEQASRLVDFALNNVIPEDGTFDPVVFGDHTHSTTAMLSGLALYGEVTNKPQVLQRVHTFVQKGLRDITLPFGWCLEKFNRDDDVGECNNTGDIIEAVFILADNGYEEYYNHAERIVRAHLLPSQLLDTSFIPNWDLPENDSQHRLATRSKGAFGFPCPYGHEFMPGSRISFNWDITGGVVLSLCEIAKRAVVIKDGRCRIKTLLSFSDNAYHIEGLDQKSGEFRVSVKNQSGLELKLPPWCGPGEIDIIIDGQSVTGSFMNNWLQIPIVKPEATIIIRFRVPESVHNYSFRDFEYTVRWRADTIVEMGGGGQRLLFFEPVAMKERS